MEKYNSLEEIELDLKRLSLERKIALEELKLSKEEIKERLSYPNWINTIFKTASKYGFYLLIKKFLK